MLPTNEIYDVDFEGLVKTPDLGVSTLYDDVVDAADAWGHGRDKSVISLNDNPAAPGPTFTQRHVDNVKYSNVDIINNDLELRMPYPFMIFVVGEGKQKVLGDWIAKYSLPTAAGAKEGQLTNITSWIFDRFCNEVRPIWAKHFIPRHISLQHKYYAQVSSGGQTQQYFLPECCPNISFEWAATEFHRYQDYGGQLTATDTYARKLGTV